MSSQNNNGSLIAGVASRLFGPNSEGTVSDSVVGRLTQKLYLSKVTMILVMTAVLLYWYEAVLAPVVPFLGSSFLPPALILTALLVSDKKMIGISRPVIWYLGFLVLALGSTLLGAVQGLNVTMLTIGWFVYVVFAVALLSAQSFEKKHLFLKGLFWAILPSAVLGIGQYFNRTGVTAQVGQTFRAVGSFDNPNVFGMVLAIGVLTGLWFSWSEKKSLYLFGVVPMMVAVVLSGSRTSLLALIIALAVAIFMVRPKILRYSPLALIVFLIPAVRARFAELLSGNYRYEMSIDGRVWTLNNGLYIWHQGPFFGFGPGSFGGKLAERYASPVPLLGLQNGYLAIATTDSSYVQMLVQLGLFGAVAFGSFVVSTVWALVASKNNLRILAVAALVALLVMMATSNALEFNAVTIPVALILGFVLAPEELKAKA